jgi:hypothetical protein
MRAHHLGLAVFAGILASVGCGKPKCGKPEVPCVAADSSRPAPATSMTTDDSLYTGMVACAPVRHPCGIVAVTITFRNPLAQAILIDRCTPDSNTPLFSVVQADARHTPATMNPDWACVGHDSPLVVPPGGSRRDVIHVGLRAEDAAPIGRVLGPFQIAYLARVGGGGALLPDSLRLSTPFRIQIASGTGSTAISK